MSPNTGYTVAPLDITNNVLGHALNEQDVPGAPNRPTQSRMDDNLGYYRNQIHRMNQSGAPAPGPAAAGANAAAQTRDPVSMLMKFRIASCGLLNQDKFLPVFAMPLTIQLRLSDIARATNKGMTGYTISRPRMHCQMISVNQATAAAYRQRMRGPGITLNYKSWDTWFSIITNSTQLVVPSNK